MDLKKPQRSTRLGAGLFAGVATFAATPSLMAAGGGGGNSLEIMLVLVAVVGVAYLLAHLLLERIADRYGIVTGVEYIVLGAFVFQVIVAPILPVGEEASAAVRIDLLFEQLRPVLVLGTGSLGLLWGTHVDLRDSVEFNVGAFAPAIVVSLSTIFFVAVLPAAATAYFFSLEHLTAIAPALVVAAAIALIAADTPIRTMENFLEARGDAPDLAYGIANVCSALAIFVFGILFGFDNAGTLVQEGPFNWALWLGIHLLVGGALGVVFGTYLRKDFSDEKILTVVIGMVVFTSGIAHGLDLSPIFVNFVLGIVLINTCRHGVHVRSMLESIKHPLYIVLFIFAGAQLDPSVPYWAYASAGPYLALRFAGRWVGGLLARPLVRSKPAPPNLGRVLFAPGGLSVAMALDFLLIYADRTAEGEHFFLGTPRNLDSVFTGLIVAIIVSEILAHTMTRRWLIDASDVKTTAPGERTDRSSTQQSTGGS